MCAVGIEASGTRMRHRITLSKKTTIVITSSKETAANNIVLGIYESEFGYKNYFTVPAGQK